MAILTNHAKKRIHKRVGVTKGFSDTFIKRVIKDGINFGQTLGKLHQFIETKATSSAINHNRRMPYILYYAGAIYLFNNKKEQVLLTVLEVEDEINKNLKEYVTEKAYLLYKRNREKYDNHTMVKAYDNYLKHKDDKEKEIENKYLEELHNYIKERELNILITSIDLKYKEDMIKVNYVSESNLNDWDEFFELDLYTQMSYNKKLYLNKIKDRNGKYVTITEYKKIKNID